MQILSSMIKLCDPHSSPSCMNLDGSKYSTKTLCPRLIHESIGNPVTKYVYRATGFIS